MTVQLAAIQSTALISEQLRGMYRGLSSLTVDPYKNALYYFFPFIGAFFSNHYPLMLDPSMDATMPLQPTRQIIGEIKELTRCAGITRTVVPYVAMDPDHQFSSSGGHFSFTKPALFLPYEDLFRQNGLSHFGAEKSGENLASHLWVLSDAETRFIICRELAQMKENNALLRIAIKVSVLAALLMIYASPFGWPTGLALFIGVLGIYIVSERIFQARADIVGADILRQKMPDAHNIAIQTLEKLRKQNIYRRDNHWLARWYITESGNNLLDFTRPALTYRIERLRANS